MVRTLRLALIVIAVSAGVVLPRFTVTGQAPEEAQFVGSSAHANAVLAALRDGLPYVPGELLVRFKAGAEPAQAQAALRVLRAPIAAANTQWIGDVLHLQAVEIDDPVHAAELLARQPEVLYAQPNYLRRHASVPNDPGYTQQWNLPLINMPQAWDISTRAGSGVTVAVIDSGITTTDGVFGFRVWNGLTFVTSAIPFAKAADFDHARVQVGVDFQPFGPWRTSNGPLLFDADGHGTHVAGTIAQQTNNGSGYAGVANGVTLLPIKACFAPWDVQLYFNAQNVPGFAEGDEDGCTSDAVVSGIRYAADNGAKAINISIGGGGGQPAEQDALNYAVSKGVFVAIAAGNEAREGNPTSYPAFYAKDINGVMAVGAVTPSRDRALYSNTGAYVEIAAPGGAGSFGSAAEQVWQSSANQSDLSILRLAPAFNRYQNLAISGTSMATPHVTALAALLYAQGVTTPAAIEAAITRFAKDLGPAGRDDEFGAGLIDARTTLRGLGVAR